MAKHNWSVLCYKACIDQDSKQISLLDVVDVLKLHEEPPPIPKDKGLIIIGPVQLQLVSQFSRSEPEAPEAAQMRFVLKLPNGKTFKQPVLLVDLNAGNRSRTILKIDQLPFSGPGEYLFLSYLRESESNPWKKVAEVPLEIQVLAKASAEGSNA